MKREQKAEVIKQYNAVFNEFSDTGAIIIAEYAGINVSSMKSLRASLTKSGAKMSVVKNRLAKIALNDTGCKDLTDYFNGPVSMVYSQDPVGLAKILVEFANDNDSLKITAGMMDGESLDTKQINALSKLPSLDELRAKLLALFMAPARDIASVISKTPIGLVQVIKAKSEKEQ